MKNIFSLFALCCAMMFTTFAVSSEYSSSNVTAIEDYVRQVYVRGIPYEQTRKIDPSAVPTLLQMLNNPKEEAYWANIVVVLEIIGDDEVVEPLIEFIEQDPGGTLSRANYAAKTSALMGMGYLINRTGNKEALNYLIEGVEPQLWEEKDVEGIVEYHRTVEERNQDLSKYAILGLALSGHPEAQKTLKALQQPTANKATSAFQYKMNNLLTGALDANAQIAKNGLLNYYQTGK